MKKVKQATAGSDISLIPVKVVAAVNSVRDVSIDTIAQGQPLKLKSPSGWEMQLPLNVNTRWLIDVLRQLT